MTKLKIDAIVGQKSVKVTLELPGEIERDLKIYAELMKRESGQPIDDPVKLIAPMLKRFMVTDRAFTKFRRQLSQERAG